LPDEGAAAAALPRLLSAGTGGRVLGAPEASTEAFAEISSPNAISVPREVSEPVSVSFAGVGGVSPEGAAGSK
jgi:hypothetical protein